MNINKTQRHKILVLLTFVLVLSMSFFTLKTTQVHAFTSVKDLEVTLIYSDQAFTYRYPDIVYNNGLDSGIEMAYSRDFRGRIKNKIKKFYCQFELKDVDEKLETIAKLIDHEPVNATITFSPDSKKKFDITPDVSGQRLNREKVKAEIEKSLSKGSSVKIKIVPEEVKAQHTVASLKKATNLRREFSTGYPFSSKERKHNIALSASCFNGLILAPEEIISFNEIVGDRTEERGYHQAKIIFNGEFIEGVGGGVCQTSTTLYNAALISGLKIIEHKKHSLAVSYITPSFDAMVNKNTADLKIQNDSDNYVFIKAFTADDRVIFQIFGEKLPYEIKRKSVVIKIHETPPHRVIVDFEGKYQYIYKGQRMVVLSSKPKTESEGYLEYYQNGELIKSQRIRKDIYNETVGIEVIGTIMPPPSTSTEGFTETN